MRDRMDAKRTSAQDFNSTIETRFIFTINCLNDYLSNPQDRFYNSYSLLFSYSVQSEFRSELACAQFTDKRCYSIDLFPKKSFVPQQHTTQLTLKYHTCSSANRFCCRVGKGLASSIHQATAICAGIALCLAHPIKKTGCIRTPFCIYRYLL